MDKKVQHPIMVLFLFIAAVLVGKWVFSIAFFLVAALCCIRPSFAIPLFFYSGILKHAPIVQAFPIDITLFSFGIAFLYLSYHLLRTSHYSEKQWKVLGILGIAWLVAVASLFYTQAPLSFLKKSALPLILMYMPLTMLLVLSSKKVLNDLKFSFAIVCVLLCTSWLGLGFHNEWFGLTLYQIKNPEAKSWHITAFGESYMIFSQMTIGLFGLLLYHVHKKSKNQLVVFTLLVLCLFALILAPARAITLGALLSLIFLALLHRKTLARFLYHNVYILFISGGLFLVLAGWISNNLGTYRLLNFSTSNNSINKRLLFFDNGYQLFQKNPFFGTGINNIAFYNESPGAHVHNIFLEAIFEFGIIGTIPILAFFGVILLSFIVIIKNRINIKGFSIWFIILYLVYGIFSLFSGSLGTVRPFWVLVSIIFLIYQHETNSEKPV